jgi:hypothetical protein
MPGYVTETDATTGGLFPTYRPGETAVVRMTKGGVITGTVTTQQGEPVVAVSVRAVRVRDLDGHTPRVGGFASAGEDRTDDRGVYRIYGLQPGLYVVYAGPGSGTIFGLVTGFAGDAPTFYPSGTRDTAAEVSVRAGQETQGIDIRYREEQGRRVTGTVEAPDPASGEFGVSVMLTYAASGMPAGGVAVGANVGANSPARSFSIEGVADGDYDVQAILGGREGLTSVSVPQRISVRGSDVTGLRLTLKPMASVSGTVVIEPAAAAEAGSEACKAVRARPLPQETLVMLAPDRPRETAARIFSRLDAAPDSSGAFSLRPLEPERYHLSIRLFDEALYVRAIQLPGSAAPAPTPRAASANAQRAATAVANAALRDFLDLKPGQQLSGVGVRLAEGAASFGGHLVAAEGTPAPPFSQLRVHLVPQERERADDPLRFYETGAGPDGAFSFKNLAPGRYLLVALADADAGERASRPAAWDADARARLRREAESANTPVELQPCQRTSDFTLRFPPSK